MRNLAARHSGTCEHVRRQLWDAPESPQVQSHLAACNACRLAAERHARLAGALAAEAAPMGAPRPDAWLAIQERLELAPVGRCPDPLPSLRLHWARLGAALVVGLGLGINAPRLALISLARRSQPILRPAIKPVVVPLLAVDLQAEPSSSSGLVDRLLGSETGWASPVGGARSARGLHRLPAGLGIGASPLIIQRDYVLPRLSLTSPLTADDPPAVITCSF